MSTSVQTGWCYDVYAGRVMLYVDISADRVMLQCLCRQVYVVMSVPISADRVML